MLFVYYKQWKQTNFVFLNKYLLILETKFIGCTYKKYTVRIQFSFNFVFLKIARHGRQSKAFLRMLLDRLGLGKVHSVVIRNSFNLIIFKKNLFNYIVSCLITYPLDLLKIIFQIQESIQWLNYLRGGLLYRVPKS